MRNADEVIQILDTLIISDDEFYQNFKIFEVKRTHTIRYLLRKIHNYSSNEMRILSDNQEIHIEHILPKKISDAEMSLLAKNEQEALVNRFGNLTLLGQEYNCRANNKGFKERSLSTLRNSIDK